MQRLRTRFVEKPHPILMQPVREVEIFVVVDEILVETTGPLEKPALKARRCKE